MTATETKYRLGFLDSGVGGISVMMCAKRFLPDGEYIYYADTDHVPYGTKSKDEIISYTDSAVRSLISKGADAVVIACNTATSVAASVMRERYPAVKIIGMEPALKPAYIRHPDGRILVCATKATIEGEKLHSLIESTGAHPDLCVASELVSFAERGIFGGDDVMRYLNTAVKDHEKYAAVVLGCTHFTFFREAFEQSFPNAEIIDGNIGAVRHLGSVIGGELSAEVRETKPTEYIRSGREVTDKKELALFGIFEERMAEYYNKL